MNGWISDCSNHMKSLWVILMMYCNIFLSFYYIA